MTRSSSSQPDWAQGLGPSGYGIFVGLVRAYFEARGIGIDSFTAMPISGFKGDNITTLSENTPWYSGPTLVNHLETVEVDSTLDQAKPFRMPVQWVNRPNLDFRGFSGLIATGAIVGAMLAPEKILDCVLSWVCTSSPMTTSQFIAFAPETSYASLWPSGTGAPR